MKRLITVQLLLLLLCIPAHAVVNTTTVKTALLAGNGSTVVFTFGFSYTATSEVVVTKRITSTGVPATQTETTHYSVSAPSDTGGTVTFVTAPAATETVTISRTSTDTQTNDIDAASYVSLTSLEASHDRTMRLVQELQEETARCFKIPITDSTSLDTEIENSVERAGLFPYFGDDGSITVAAGVTGGR